MCQLQACLHFGFGSCYRKNWCIPVDCICQLWLALKERTNAWKKRGFRCRKSRRHLHQGTFDSSWCGHLILEVDIGPYVKIYKQNWRFPFNTALDRCWGSEQWKNRGSGHNSVAPVKKIRKSFASLYFRFHNGMYFTETAVALDEEVVSWRSSIMSFTNEGQLTSSNYQET